VAAVLRQSIAHRVHRRRRKTPARRPGRPGAGASARTGFGSAAQGAELSYPTGLHCEPARVAVEGWPNVANGGIGMTHGPFDQS
jgi:hypothetical protein